MILSESTASLCPGSAAYAPNAWLTFRWERCGVNPGGCVAEHASESLQARVNVWELVDGGLALSSGSSHFLNTNCTLRLSAFGRIHLNVEP